MKINTRTIIFGVIIIICIIAVVIAIYIPISEKIKQGSNPEQKGMTVTEENKQLAGDFKTLFENRLDYQGNNINTLGVNKKEGAQDIVYNYVSTKRVVENRYDIDLNIPVINISNNTSVERFNEKVQSLFIDKANDIMQNATLNTIYSVDYMAYVNTNILSLVIRSILKEGNNPQRVIIQTYNYNLSTNEEMTLDAILDIKALNKQEVESTIINEVELASQQAESLRRLGYNVYTRNLESEIYKLENTDNYILGPNNKLYVIYPYGNANFTDELDVIVF